MFRDQYGPLVVHNAGMVLLHNWLPMLFARLGLLEGQRFASVSAQSHAVHVLQFLATGREDVPEQYLVLNKVLCGLPLDAAVEEAAPLSEHDRATASSLITAAVGAWPAIGNTSVDSFRDNWLVRDGTLQEAADRWELIVERRIIDVLLATAPFSYTFVKHEWMAKPLYVNWPT